MGRCSVGWESGPPKKRSARELAERIDFAQPKGRLLWGVHFFYVKEIACYVITFIQLGIQTSNLQFQTLSSGAPATQRFIWELDTPVVTQHVHSRGVGTSFVGGYAKSRRQLTDWYLFCNGSGDLSRRCSSSKTLWLACMIFGEGGRVVHFLLASVS